MKEKRPVKRIVLSIIAIAVIIAMVAVMIVASVRAEEPEPETHPAPGTETIEETMVSEQETKATESITEVVNTATDATDAAEPVNKDSTLLPDLDRTFMLTLEESDDFYRQNASVAGYMPDEPAKASDMLYGLILPSGADCALGLANVTAGNMEAFTTLMNLEGKKMGLWDSNFTNTSGKL